mmetsp:Transcript_1704/g.3635  ORF Transcript_1704/g.3635 Transcript_1704/m.3635 type:complete len:556 (-) Transcript_1704:20-1687(-)
MSQEEVYGEHELLDLRQRMHLLEGDRKTIYEEATSSIKRNSEIISQLQRENKELRSQMMNLAKLTSAPSAKVVEEAREEVKLRRKLDLFRSEANRRKSELETLQNKLKEINSDQRSSAAQEDTPEMRQIRVLENRLDKAMIKYNEAQSIRKTYEQIVKRLKEERVGFDNQLAAIERSLKGKEHDYEELLLLSHDANHAKEMSEAELRRTEAQITVERMMREKEIQEKKTEVKSRVEAMQQLEAEERRKKMNADGANQHQFSQLSLQLSRDNLSQRQTEEDRIKILGYEEAFRRIKESTGVSDVNEVIQKFTTQGDTLRNLEELRRDNQRKLDELTRLKADLKQEVDALRFSAGEALTRKQVDEIENEVSLTEQSYEKTRAKYERLAKILLDLKAGTEHLSEKLETVPDLRFNSMVVTEDNLNDVLRNCETVVNKVFKEVKRSEVYNLLQSEKHKLPKSTGRSPRKTISVLQTIKTVPSLSNAAGIIESSSMAQTRARIAREDEENSDEGLDDELNADIVDRKKIKHEYLSRVDRLNKSKTKRVRSAAPVRRFRKI